MSIAKLARAEIQALQPYQAAMQRGDTVRLNANEAPWCSPDEPFRRPLNRYPEIRPARLRSALAQRFGCDSQQLLVTRGTSEAIDLLIRAFCRAGEDNIVTLAPSFSMYGHYAEIQNAAVREVVLDREQDFRPDVDALLAACNDNSRLVFVCSPNNPTGTAFPANALTELLERRGHASAIVVDEAYIEFSDTASSCTLLDKYDNLIVLRTLSKALAFAGVRCGAVMGPPAVIDMLNAIQAPYALATPVVECVEDALAGNRLQEAADQLRLIVEERERLIRELQKLRFVQRIWPSAANFFLLQADDAPQLMQHCAENNILLRQFGGALADCLRITVGNRDENERLLTTLQAV